MRSVVKAMVEEDIAEATEKLSVNSIRFGI